jgi:UDP-glucose 4-epimerase
VTVLVTGGAGYIGAHTVDALRDRGDRVVVVDDLSAGLRSRITDVPLELIDLTAADAVVRLAAVMRDHGIRAIIHLAARKQVAESVARPNWYYAQNVGGLVAVLAAAREAGVERVVFSSTAAVYGESGAPVTELSPTAPANPYGETKLAGEWLLRDETIAQGMRGISLRYFNVAGAARPELADTAESNIVPMVFGRIARGLGPQIFGDDYDTVDGTCVRDYVHVADVARAHLDALDALDDPAATPYRVYNLGTGRGSSVREMVETMTEIAGSTILPVIEPRRAGDPAVVVADASRIRAELGWTPRHDLREILTSAWTARPAKVPGTTGEPG